MNYYEMLLARKLAKGELPPNAYLLKTASGSLVSFADGADLPMPSFVCNIDAVQDLHGYDHPWVGEAGKNKLQVTGTSQTINGVTFTVNDDGTIKVNGTATADARFNFGTYNAKAQTRQIMNGLPDSVTDDTIKMGYQGYGTINKTTRELVINRNVDTDWSNDTYILIQSGVTVNNLVFKPMIRLATETDPTFAPYENICPISGHAGVDAWVRGKNLAEDGFAWNVNTDGIIESAALYNTSIIPVRKNESYIQTINGVPANIGVIAFYYEHPSIGSQSYNKSRSVNLMSPIFTAPINGYAVIRNTATDTNIQIEKGNIATSYEPYNPNSQTISVSWQTEAGEVFGGYVDLVSGVLTVTHKSQTGFTRGSQDSSNKLYNIGSIADIKAFTDARNISPYFIDNMFEKMSVGGARVAETPSIAQHNTTLYVGGYIGKEAELDTLLETLQVKYELETPITYQLTPTQIKSLLGNNNAWCSTGDVTLEYFGKGAE